MGLAGTWETPDGDPTMTFFIVLGVALTLVTVGVVLGLRWHDRRQLLRDGQPWRQVILQNSELIQQAKHVIERHERIICYRGQWLADQVTEQGESLDALGDVVGEIRSYLVPPGHAPKPRLKVIKG